jgi:hypothetical protein
MPAPRHSSRWSCVAFAIMAMMQALASRASAARGRAGTDRPGRLQLVHQLDRFLLPVAPYPFIPVIAIPLMNSLCARKNTMTTGSTTTNDAAIR